MICRHEGVCGGCGLQALPYVEQLHRKTRALLDRLPAAARQAATEPLFLPVFDGEPWHFRQKVAFVFGAGADGQLIMGHYGRGSQRVVPVAECPVHSARGNRIAFALRDRLAAARVSAAGPSLTGIVRHVLVRATVDDREAVAMLVVARNDKALRKPVRALLASADRPDGFYINVHDQPGPYMIGRTTIRIDGQSQIRERVAGLSYLVSPTAFFQTNVRAAAALQRQVVEWSEVTRADGAASGRRILELYAGSGLFTLPLAAAGASVLAVEENRQAVADARSNLRLNRLPATAIRFLASRVEDALATVERDRWDVVVMDPPRQGCPAAVLEAVFRRIAPSLAVYVSCNPETLADELPRILAMDYVVDAIRAVDMFPHTGHIETVVKLVRRAGAATGMRARRQDLMTELPVAQPERTLNNTGRRGPS